MCVIEGRSLPSEMSWCLPWGLLVVVLSVLQPMIYKSCGCHVEERAALMDIRSSLIRANSTPTVPRSWGRDDDCCSWERVKCDRRTKRVSRLNLTCILDLSEMSIGDDNYHNLVWHLNITVFSAFHELQFLDLSQNYRTSLSFDGLAGLTKLWFLYLGGNGLEGNFPPSLGNLVSLEVMDFSNNDMNGTISVAAFENLTNLRKLDLSFDRFHGNLPVSLFSLPRLKVLDLYANYFEGGIPLNSLPVSLEVLKLNNNQLNGTLPSEKALENLKNLRELHLGSNQFTGNIPRSLFSLPHIELLDLSGNHFEGAIPISSSSNLPVSLKSLQFYQNNLTGKFSFFWLRNLANLEEVDLSENANLAVEVNIPGWVPLFQLKQLKLSGCDLDKSIITEPHFLQTQHHLEALDLSNNNLPGSMPNWLFTTEATLFELDLGNNLLTGSLESIWYPQKFLQTINISTNRVTGQLPENISTIFPNLRLLDCSNNNIYGHIPMELCQIRLLWHLDLSKNTISGAVPACFFTEHIVLVTLKVSENNLGGLIFSGMDNLSIALWYLYLDRNKYEGSMPQNLSAENLLVMDLHDNKLSGKLDTSFWNMPSLIALNLAGNTLTGEIHPNFFNFTQIVLLDLSNNNLTGSIPKCNRVHAPLLIRFLDLSNNSLSGDISYAFFNTHNLIAMDIRHNQFTGNLSWVQNIKDIRILSLGGNKFEGQISPNICRLQYLMIIDFSHNKLSGPLPECIGNISFNNGDDRIFLLAYSNASNAVMTNFDSSVMKRYGLQGFVFSTKGYLYTYGGNFFNSMSGIDLSANMLNGEIPWQLGNLNHIKSLNLSYNFFTDQIPARLAGMEEIESLDLSHNNLSGSIPWQLTQLSSLGAFSVAYNNLSGCIPNYGQLGSFGMDSYLGNNNLHNTSQGSRCSPSLGPMSGPVSKEYVGEGYDDPVLYFVTAASFVLAFCITVAFSFFHSYRRSVVLKM